MRCPPSAEPLPGRLSPQAQFRPVRRCAAALAPARREKLHRTRACSRLTGGAVRQNGNVSHQPWAAKRGECMSTGALITDCWQVSPASHNMANSQHPGDGRRAAALSCGRNVEAGCSTALSKARGPGVHSEQKWRSARQQRSVDMRHGVHLSAAETLGTTDARHARHPYNWHAVSLLGPSRAAVELVTIRM